MNCPELESKLADFIDGTLPPAERAAIEDHLSACAGCREFVAEIEAGLSLLSAAEDIEPPAELITRIAYQAPFGKLRDPFDEESWWSRFVARRLAPILQPRLAMGMAMTVLSFAMLERCTGIQTQHLQPADLNPVRVWGGVEDRAMRVKDRVVKYYDNLRIVYEIESRLKDLQEQDASSGQQPRQSSAAQNQPRPSGAAQSLDRNSHAGDAGAAQGTTRTDADSAGGSQTGKNR
jgi:hypothetical protein